MIKKRALLFSSLFFAFLLAGIWAGRRMQPAAFTLLPETLAQTWNAWTGATHSGPSGPADPVPSPPSPTVAAAQPVAITLPTQSPAIVTPTATSAPRQHNLLILGADSLESDAPRLESVWIAMYFPGAAHITLMAVYPPPESPQASGLAPTLPDYFALDRDGAPVQAFTAHLQASGLWWTDYVLFDENGLLNVLDLANTFNAAPWNGIDAIASLPRAAEDAASAHVGQLMLMQQLCRAAGRAASADSVKIAELFALRPQHMAASLSLEDALLEWEGLFLSGGSLTCEFPTLVTAQTRP